MSSEIEGIQIKITDRADSIMLKTEKGEARNVDVSMLSDKARGIFGKALFQIFDKDKNNILTEKELNGSYEKLSYFIESERATKQESISPKYEKVNGKTIPVWDRADGTEKLKLKDKEIRFLGFLGDQIALLKNKDPKERAKAAYSLGNYSSGDPREIERIASIADLTVPVLLDALKGEKDNTARWGIISGLAEIADVNKFGEKIMPEFLEGLKSEDARILHC